MIFGVATKHHRRRPKLTNNDPLFSIRKFIVRVFFWVTQPKMLTHSGAMIFVWVTEKKDINKWAAFLVPQKSLSQSRSYVRSRIRWIISSSSNIGINQNCGYSKVS